MYILGISAFYHDSAACIIQDGVIAAAAQEERFTRKKHDYSFPINAIKFCLDYANLNSNTIDYIAFYDKPFLKFGAPWIDSRQYANDLNALKLKGIRFKPISFTPVSIPNIAYKPKYESQLCGGVEMEIIDRDNLKPVTAMLIILEKTRELYPENFALRQTLNRLYGSDKLGNSLSVGAPSVKTLIDDWLSDLDNFTKTSEKYHLYH